MPSVNNNELAIKEITVPKDESNQSVSLFVKSILVPIVESLAKDTSNLPVNSLHCVPRSISLAQRGFRVSFLSDEAAFTRLSGSLKRWPKFFSSIDINKKTNKISMTICKDFVGLILEEAKNPIAESKIPYKAFLENYNFLTVLAVDKGAQDYLSEISNEIARLKERGGQDKVNVFCKILLNIGLAYWQKGGETLSPLDQMQIFLRAMEAITKDDIRTLSSHSSRWFRSGVPTSYDAFFKFKIKLTKDLTSFVSDAGAKGAYAKLNKVAENRINQGGFSNIEEGATNLEAVSTLLFKTLKPKAARRPSVFSAFSTN